MMGDAFGPAIFYTDGEGVTAVEWHTPQWEASLQWAAQHGIRPDLVPAGSTIEYDPARRTLSWSECQLDEQGVPRIDAPHQRFLVRLRCAQLEAAPLPFPQAPQ